MHSLYDEFYCDILSGILVRIILLKGQFFGWMCSQFSLETNNRREILAKKIQFSIKVVFFVCTIFGSTIHNQNRTQDNTRVVLLKTKHANKTANPRGEWYIDSE